MQTHDSAAVREHHQFTYGRINPVTGLAFAAPSAPAALAVGFGVPATGTERAGWPRSVPRALVFGALSAPNAEQRTGRPHDVGGPTVRLASVSRP